MKLQKSNKVNTTESQQKLVRKKAKLNSNWFRRVLGIAGGRFQDAHGNVYRGNNLKKLFVVGRQAVDPHKTYRAD